MKRMIFVPDSGFFVTEFKKFVQVAFFDHTFSLDILYESGSQKVRARANFYFAGFLLYDMCC